MYRFALRPWWIVSHIFCLFLAVLFIWLGLWQIGRYYDRLDRNEVIESRQSEAPVPLDELVSVDDDGGDAIRYRHVTVTGTYVADSDLLVDNRSKDGLPGAWVVTLLQAADGTVTPVSRGFLGFNDGALTPPPAPTGSVSIDGTLVPWDSDCGVRSDDAGVPIGTACVNQTAVADVLASTAAAGAPLRGPLVQTIATSPVDAPQLSPVPFPELGEGSHRSYAAQWFIFAAIGIIGYPIILRRVARDKAAEASSDSTVDAP